MGKIFVFCRIKLKLCSWLYKKRWHTSWKFQLKITSYKKVIAKKPLTNLYEMNSTYHSVNVVIRRDASTFESNKTLYSRLTSFNALIFTHLETRLCLFADTEVVHWTVYISSLLWKISEQLNSWSSTLFLNQYGNLKPARILA